MMTMILPQQKRRSVRWTVLTYAGEAGSRCDAGLFQSQPAIRVSITSVLSKEQSAQDSGMPEADTVHRSAQLYQVPADVPSTVATDRGLLAPIPVPTCEIPHNTTPNLYPVTNPVHQLVQWAQVTHSAPL